MGTVSNKSIDPWADEEPPWSKTADHTRILLKEENQKTGPTVNVTIDEIIGNSSAFPVRFTTETNRCKYLKSHFSQELLEKNINSAYPLIHEKALYLCTLFLAHKRKFGSDSEKTFYQNLSLLDLIDRLLIKRAVTFIGEKDYYHLIDGNDGYGKWVSIGTSKWESIGTSNEQKPLILQNCLSYDEIKLSALIGVSSNTVFVNDGNRHNIGIFEENREKIQNCGVIIGLVGPRFERKFVMDYQEIIKSAQQNTHYHGYGIFFIPTIRSVFLNFYNDNCDTYDALKKSGYFNNKDRFVELYKDVIFDKLIYELRISITIDTLLLEANERAKNENSTAYIHVVGLGLGVWKIYEQQNKIYMDTFHNRIKSLSSSLNHISDICFAYIRKKSLGPYKNGDTLPIKDHPLGGIKIHIRNREPHERLQGIDSEKLLVVSFAWDGNSLPGNEYWQRALAASSDPAAACSTQICEIHNAHINPKKISGRNLKVVTIRNGIVTFEDYKKKIEEQILRVTQ